MEYIETLVENAGLKLNKKNLQLIESIATEFQDKNICTYDEAVGNIVRALVVSSTAINSKEVCKELNKTVNDLNAR